MNEIDVKVVGWLKGLNGTGNVFELNDNGVKTLAMIWDDGKFHEIDKQSILDQVSKGTAKITIPLLANYETMRVDDIETAGFERFFTSNEPEPVTTGNSIKIPYKIEGTLTIDLSDLNNVLNHFFQ